ncbi:hypothetical protein [Pandoraea sp. NPDC090278]|uniref:hypothetical protein n=1 Tax=Pandoraea sp. NPDC090278 TaxID=3364391 RepID=UPI00383B59B2
MTPEEVLKMFERLCIDDLALDPDDAVTEFASWLAESWTDLSDDDIATLTSVGATLFEAGLKRRIIREL